MDEKAILDYLGQRPTNSATTRAVANQFLKRTYQSGWVVIPGNQDMGKVYGKLSRMAKKGLVERKNGIWKIPAHKTA